MKRYWKVKDGEGNLTGETYVKVFAPAEQKDCSLCRAMNQYINEVPDRQVGLKQCQANLRSHLATGKHWKEVSDYYIKSRH
jgi:hypothetical protein